jgi:hypothetical protein
MIEKMGFRELQTKAMAKKVYSHGIILHNALTPAKDHKFGSSLIHVTAIAKVEN